MNRAQKKKTGSRDYQSYLLIGGKGQGKSTYLRDAIDEYFATFTAAYQNSRHNPRVFVHDMSGSRAFADIPRIDHAAERMGLKLDHPLDLLKMKDPKTGRPLWKSGALRYECRKFSEIQYMHEQLAAHFRNGCLILDEWTTYIRANPPDWQIDIVNNHRNYGLEVFFVCHQIMRVPPFFVRGDMIAKIILFKTGEKKLQYKQIANKYSCADDLWDAFQRVMKAKERDTFVQYHEIIEV